MEPVVDKWKTAFEWLARVQAQGKNSGPASKARYFAASSPGANKKISCESLYEGLHEVVHHIIGAQRGVGYERSG
jgi:hypothetical protein